MLCKTLDLIPENAGHFDLSLWGSIADTMWRIEDGG